MSMCPFPVVTGRVAYEMADPAVAVEALRHGNEIISYSQQQTCRWDFRVTTS